MPKIALFAAPLLLSLPAALWASQESGSANPQVCGTIRSVFAMTGDEAHAYQRENLEHVKLGMRQVREHVAQLSQARRVELREATGFAVEHCPYTRATIELVQLMRDSAHEATASEAQATGCRVENAPLTLLVSTLDEHWAMLEDIGAVLPPVEGACQAGTQTRFDAFYASLNTLNERVGALDDETRKRLGTSNTLASRETATLWNSAPALVDYNKWMDKANDTATNPALASGCKSVAHAIEMYMKLGC